MQLCGCELVGNGDWPVVKSFHFPSEMGNDNEISGKVISMFFYFYFYLHLQRKEMGNENDNSKTGK